MRFNLDNALGIHADALKLRARRGEILASNLANADTPGYKARDLDFKAVLGQAEIATPTSPRLARTDARHLDISANDLDDGELLYRTPLQPSLDGNTVDTQVEKGKFAENAMQYMASLRFINGRISGLQTALRGE